MLKIEIFFTEFKKIFNSKDKQNNIGLSHTFKEFIKM